ncbi:MAG: hypothetical protein UY72_C0022G0004 [Candidatus Uhrbacteria bacterium GW2011_GWD2_52_7]|uniref:Uncharacterized protein n=1 Tax=Candidatus Uhrbacteria bacterium GW2011_GWD2_52_7 TaxID=1618989 RepID=A0A0G1XGU8_9BACT|nr:MAG: hypothetical protein UY72_C0022G0004 [Candidatus Uhrbacteria bacterium GW2011_GWD2_52_7]
MRVALSSTTVESYLPEIRQIFSFLEMELFEYSEKREKKDFLTLFYLGKEMGTVRLDHAVTILEQWFRGTPFTVENLGIKKSDPTVPWSNVVDIIEEKLIEFANRAPLIELTLTSSGHISRTIGNVTLSHDFEGDSKKVDLLNFLANHNGFIGVDEICLRIDCKSTGALNVMKKSINDILGVKLQLPKTKELIEGRRGSGYQVDPLYNVVTIR